MGALYADMAFIDIHNMHTYTQHAYIYTYIYTTCIHIHILTVGKRLVDLACIFEKCLPSLKANL